MALAPRRELLDPAVSRRDIVAVGGSAGSFQSLKRIARDLPASMPAAVFIVIHRAAMEGNWLADLLNREGNLLADQARDGERIEPGRIYIGPPDRHLLVAEGHIHLTRGPKEGLHRPSINMTFRSAALAYQSRVVGVLLSGMLDDGASGLWEIVHHGGVSIIQNPEEAPFPSMPLQALKDVPINFKLRSDEIAPRLVELANGNGTGVHTPKSEEFINDVSPEKFSGFTCPECRGPLYEHRQTPLEFRCRTGHLFNLETLLEESASTRERKLYEAIVSLEEGADLAEYAAKRGGAKERREFQAEAQRLRHCALAVRKLVQQPRQVAAEEL